MPDARHNRNGTRRHRTRKRLVVEGHEVLVGSAAANEQDAIGGGPHGRRAPQARYELGRRPLPLDLGSDAHELHQRVAPTERALHVVDHRPRERRDHGHARAERRDGALAGLVHKAFAAKFLGKRSHLLTQQPLPRQRERLCHEAHAPRGLVQVEVARELDLHAVAQVEGPLPVHTAPDDAVDRRAVVLNLEIAVTASRVRAAKPRDLAYDGKRRQRVNRAGSKLDGLRYRERVIVAAGSSWGIRALPRKASLRPPASARGRALPGGRRPCASPR